MLEEIKEVLIKEKKDELERKKKIDNEIKKEPDASSSFKVLSEDAHRNS